MNTYTCMYVLINEHPALHMLHAALTGIKVGVQRDDVGESAIHTHCCIVQWMYPPSITPLVSLCQFE